MKHPKQGQVETGDDAKYRNDAAESFCSRELRDDFTKYDADIYLNGQLFTRYRKSFNDSELHKIRLLPGANAFHVKPIRPNNMPGGITYLGLHWWTGAVESEWKDYKEGYKYNVYSDHVRISGSYDYIPNYFVIDMLEAEGAGDGSSGWLPDWVCHDYEVEGYTQMICAYHHNTRWQKIKASAVSLKSHESPQTRHPLSVGAGYQA